MTNYWAIAIGINQYQHLQPLMYAERDAEALHQFWITEAGIPAEQCWLLGDSVPQPGQKPAVSQPGNPAQNLKSSLPTQDMILEALTDLCQRRLHADDVLWVSFSGYGTQHQGNDYLMPIEADPTQLPEGAIALERIFQLLQAAPTDNILLLLDINRSQGSVGGTGVGRQTIQLAQDFGVPLILSSRPEQFSHETLMLRQGLFTAALLDGLRNQGCLTLEQMVQFLRDRLPQLSQHHWRPRQDIVAVIPDTLRYQLMLPGKLADGNYNGNQNGAGRPELAPNPGGTEIMPQPETPSNPVPVPPSEPSVPTEPGSDERAWQRIIRFGGLALLTLLSLVVVRNIQTVLQSTGADPASPTAPTQPATSPAPTAPAPDGQAPASPTQPAPPPPSPGTDPSELPAVGSAGGVGDPSASTVDPVEANRQLLDRARASLTRVRDESDSNQVSEIFDAIQQVRQIQPDQPLYAEAQQYAERWSGMILDMAVGRAARRNGGDSVVAAQNYQEAIAAAQLVPADYPDLYNSARRSIAVWSQEMMDLALLHASEGALGLAIEVANYIPQNTPAYADAQRSLFSWQAQLDSQETAQQAADLPADEEVQ